MKFTAEDFRNHFQAILSGDIFRKDEIKKNYLLIIIIFVLFGLYIDNGYRAQRQQVRIAELDKKIEESNYEYLSLSATYVDKTRQSVVAKKLQEKGSKIQISTTPATRIK